MTTHEKMEEARKAFNAGDYETAAKLAKECAEAADSIAARNVARKLEYDAEIAMGPGGMREKAQNDPRALAASLGGVTAQLVISAAMLEIEAADHRARGDVKKAEACEGQARTNREFAELVKSRHGIEVV